MEDDPSLLVLGREILTELGYDVTTARSGIEALELLDQRLRRLDLLVTDVVMPGMGGRALAQEALARYPDLRILFVSGYAGDFRPPLDPRTPNATLLEKPYTPLSLARKVREVLEAASGRTSDASLPR